MNVADLMTADPIALSPSDSIVEAWDIMDSKKIRHLPITQDDELVGLVSHRDIATRALAGLDNLPTSEVRDYLKVQSLHEIMVSGVETVAPDDDIRVAAETMFEQKLGCLPVVEGVRLVGILTEADFVRYVAGVED